MVHSNCLLTAARLLNRQNQFYYTVSRIGIKAVLLKRWPKVISNWRLLYQKMLICPLCLNCQSGLSSFLKTYPKRNKSCRTSLTHILSRQLGGIKMFIISMYLLLWYILVNKRWQVHLWVFVSSTSLPSMFLLQKTYTIVLIYVFRHICSRKHVVKIISSISLV